MRKQRKEQLFIVSLALIISLVGYNYWSYRSGRCTVSMLLSLSPVAYVLIGCILIAGVILVFLKFRKYKELHTKVCTCGQKIIDEEWCFCPCCGEKNNCIS